MSARSLKEVLARASVIAGIDLTTTLPKSIEAEQAAIDEQRAKLANARTRKQYDKELDKQAKRATKEKSGQRAFRLRKSNKQALAKLNKRLIADGVENPHPNIIPAHLWKMCQHILADASGWASQYYARLCWHKIGVSLTHRAALCYDSDNQPRYTYFGNSREALRARYVLALGLLLLGLAKPTGRKKHGWTRLVSGIPQAAFLAALRDPFTGVRPHRNTLDGTHRGDKPDSTAGDVGYLTALYRIGLCYARQAKWKAGDDPADQKGWADIRPEEKLGKEQASGWFTSLNRYWIVSDRYSDPVDAAKQAELYVAWLAGTAYPEFVDASMFRRSITEQANAEQREAPS